VSGSYGDAVNRMRGKVASPIASGWTL
jgi:hypothetical protein